jgi:hypothetical protein
MSKYGSKLTKYGRLMAVNVVHLERIGKKQLLPWNLNTHLLGDCFKELVQLFKEFGIGLASVRKRMGLPTIADCANCLASLGLGLQEFSKQRERVQQEADKQREQQIEDGKARQEILAKYLDQMAELLQKDYSHLN